MKVCIPTTNDGGLGSRLSPHFGKAPFFALVEVEGGRVRALRNQGAQHEPGECNAAKAVEGTSVDAVVCRGMGGKALESFRARGIAVLQTEAWKVSDAVRALREGRLTPLTPEHAHRHGHD